MAVHIFTGNVIAVIWDFDKTLIPGYQQHALFEYYNIDEGVFWKEVNQLKDYYAKQNIQITEATVYLNHLLTYVKQGKLHGLNNKKLRDLGANLDFYPGMPEFMDLSKQSIEKDERFAKHSITLEHYIVSTGLRQMILGSRVNPYVRKSQEPRQF